MLFMNLVFNCKVATVESWVGSREPSILDSNLVFGQILTFRPMGQRKVQVKAYLLLELKWFLQVGVDPTTITTK